MTSFNALHSLLKSGLTASKTEKWNKLPKFHKVMITKSGEELKLVGGLQVFNCYVNSEYLGNRKAVEVQNI